MLLMLCSCCPHAARSYLTLLQEGAAHHRLDPAYVAWLNSIQGIDSRERGDTYYTAAASGAPLPALPKIRTGSQTRRGGGRGRGQRDGGSGKGAGRGGRQGA